MLNKIFDNSPDLEGLTFHFDQEWQHQNQSYHQRLKNNGIMLNISRK